MLKRQFLVVITSTLVGMSFPSIGQNVPTTAPGWNPSEFQLSTDGPCSLELEKASVLLKLRDSGQSREQASNALPTEPGASASTVKSILDDIYENPAIAHFPYFIYRNITCMRRHLGKPTPATLTSVAPQVMKCQRKFGVAASDHLISCIQHVVAGKSR